MVVQPQVVRRWLYSELGLWVGGLVQKRKILGETCTPDITTHEYTRTKKGGSNRYKQNKTVSRRKQQKHLTYQHAHTYTYLDAHICTEIYVDACTYIYR